MREPQYQNEYLAQIAKQIVESGEVKIVAPLRGPIATLLASAPAMLAALTAVQEAIAYTGASALPRDAGVDWQAVTEQVDVAIYRATNIGTQEDN